MFQSERAKSPNDPKLSDGRGWRGPCMVGGEGGGPEARAVTATPVRCSAWLGDVGMDASIANTEDETNNREHGIKHGRLMTEE